LTKLNYPLLNLVTILDMAEVETPSWRATSANGIPYFSTNWAATSALT
jgi:hypothetical protein